MKVGIRYCGGCNPRYDRGAYVKSTVQVASREWETETPGENVPYQLLLVIGGCPELLCRV